MKLRAVIFAHLLAIVAICWVPQRSSAQAPVINPGRVPVVVELFTSEGCSSCPPADALLQRLVAAQPVTRVEIIALEEHVDYWNRDGWLDPFSSPDWTQRQLAYASLFKNDAYTPEAVVNGESQFVGNDANRAKTEIEKAAAEVMADVAITAAGSVTNGSQRFNVSVGKLDQGRDGDVPEVWMAITEDGLHSSVSKGENAGRVLQHVATLRSLQKLGSVNLKKSSSFTADPVVKFNPQWKLENLHVAVFVQQKKSRKIIGAASIKVNG